jgi:uncharacterized coiled-coil protein SlyX
MPYNNTETNKTDGAYTDPNQNPDLSKRWEHGNLQQYKEEVYTKITELLMKKYTELEVELEVDNIEALQKTYTDGTLMTGNSNSGMMVVYESDIDANTEEEKIKDALLKWLDFADVSQLTIKIESDPSNLIFQLPNKIDFDMNKQLGVMGLTDIGIKDNISQFMGIKQTKTNINRNKLSEYVDTEFSELIPQTFTHLIERYNKLKQQIPFYRYRTDAFFNEYRNANVPIEYRIEKFFEEFDNIKDEIPAGSLTNVSSINALTQATLFGYGTMTYLLKEARIKMNDGDVPEWSTNQVIGFIDLINKMESDMETIVANSNLLDTENVVLEDLLTKYGAYDLQSDIENLTAENFTLQDDFKTAAETAQEVLNTTVETKDSKISELNDNITTKDNEISQLNNNITTKANTISELNDRVSELDNQISQLNDSIATKTNTISQQNDSITTKTNIISQLNNSITTKDAKISQLNNSITTKDNEILQLNNSITTKDAKISDLNFALSHLKNNVFASYTDVNDDGAVNVLDMVNTHNTYRRTLDTRNTTITTKDNEILQLNNSITTKDAKISQLNDMIANLQSTISSPPANTTTPRDTVTNTTTPRDDVIKYGHGGIHNKQCPPGQHMMPDGTCMMGDYHGQLPGQYRKGGRTTPVPTKRRLQ